MRVVMVVGPSTGGIGTHVTDLTTRLRRLGEEVEVVTEPRTAQRFGLDDARLWFPGRIVGALGSLRGMARLRRLAATADVVHAHGHQAGVVALLATLGMRTPVVVSLHNAVLPTGRLRRALGDAVQRLVARRAALVTGASSDLVATAQEFGATRAELAEVPSPRVPALLAADAEDATERADDAEKLLQENGIRATGPLVLTVSRIAPQKSLEVVVDAAAALGTPATWVVAGSGDGDLLASLETRAAGLGAPVHFVGLVADPTPWLRAAEVFVLPSQWEARALVVQEAMAAGTPVVATDTGGLPDLVAGAGATVPVGDPGSVARAVGRVLRDAELRASMSQQARTVAASWDDSDDTARRWRVRYSALCDMT
jgi:glycosyltransferase involved in cell wall biosynthesis